MTELSGVPSFGGGGYALRTPPTPEKSAVPEVSKPSGDGASNTAMGQDLRGAKAEEALAERRIVSRMEIPTTPATGPETKPKEIGPDTIPGPSPAFQASLLEIESDLKNVIAKIEEARTRAQDEGAVAPSETASSDDSAPETRAGERAERRERPEPANDAKPAEAPEPRQAEAAQATPKSAEEGETFALQTPYDVKTAPAE